MTTYNDQLSEYITSLFVQEDEILQNIRKAIPAKGLPTINIKPEEGRFLEFLTRMAGARKVLEVGTLGGYSGVWITRGLAPGGCLITLEVDPRHADVAREHFEQASLADRIEIRVGNAHELLEELTEEAPFDLVFIDAEKPGYADYFYWALENVRVGGVIAAHNAFRGGSVAGAREDDDHSAVMRRFNQRVANEERAISTIFPAGDGTVLSVKIAE